MKHSAEMQTMSSTINFCVWRPSDCNREQVKNDITDYLIYRCSFSQMMIFEIQSLKLAIIGKQLKNNKYRNFITLICVRNMYLRLSQILIGLERGNLIFQNIVCLLDLFRLGIVLSVLFYIYV